MGLFRIRRRLYMRVLWREENQLSLGVSFLFLVSTLFYDAKVER